MIAVGKLIARRGALLAAGVAFIAGLPSLALPFLSDDWIHLASVARGDILTTTFRYVRPLCGLSYWLEWSAFGLEPALYHLTNTALAALAAFLVVIALRRYTGDGFLAGSAGLLFALHPYHVENVAWVSGRADLLAAVFLLGAALTFDRWRERCSSIPLAAFVLYELALLSKESAVVFPGLLLVVAAFDRARRPGAREIAWGYLPIVLLSLVHFLVVRPLALDDLGLVNRLQWIGSWPRRLYFYVVSTLVPLQSEKLEADPIVWGLVAAGAGLLLLVLARVGGGRVPVLAWPAIVAFVALLGPNLVSFQERFFYLAGAASAVVIASLLRAAPRRAGLTLALVLAGGWTFAAADRWVDWRVAGRVSEKLMARLVRTAARDEVREIVVAGMPHRVAGVAVRADFTQVLQLFGDRGVRVFGAAEMDYPSATDDALAPPRELAVERLPAQAAVRFEIPRRLYSRYVWPLAPHGENTLETEWGRIVFDGPRKVEVHVRAKRGRAAFVWDRGELEPLLEP